MQAMESWVRPGNEAVTFTHDPKYHQSGIFFNRKIFPIYILICVCLLFVVCVCLCYLHLFIFVYLFVFVFVVTIFGLQRLTGVGCRMLS